MRAATVTDDGGYAHCVSSDTEICLRYGKKDGARSAPDSFSAYGKIQRILAEPLPSDG